MIQEIKMQWLIVKHSQQLRNSWSPDPNTLINSAHNQDRWHMLKFRLWINSLREINFILNENKYKFDTITCKSDTHS